MMTKRAGTLALVIIALAVFWMRPEKRVGRNADASSFVLSAHAQTANYGGVSITSYASNCVPLAPTASTLQCGSLTDSGALVTSTVPIKLPDTAGSGVPSLKGATAATGVYMNGTNVGLVSGTNGWLSTAGTAATAAQLPVAGALGWSTSASIAAAGSDTFLSKLSTGIVRVGTSATLNDAGTFDAATYQYRGLAQTYFVTSDFTTSGSGTALEAITGLAWTFPATTVINARVDCDILYNQNVANVAVAFGFQDATVAPTNLAASGIQYTSATASTQGTLAASATTTATNVTSATPSAITTIWHAQLHFLIEQPSNASTSVFTINVSTAAAADTVTVKRGSYCSLAQ